MPHPSAPRRFERSPGTARRSRVIAVTGVAVAGLVAALALPGTAGAVGTPGAAGGSGPVSNARVQTHAAVHPQLAVARGHYTRLQPLCGPAKPGQMTCFAIRTVPVSVKPGTPLPDGVQPAATVGNGPTGGYAPSDLAALYGYSRTTGGKGQTIGIVDWFDDPSAVADLDHFDAHYGLPAETGATFKKVNQKGKLKPLPHKSGTTPGPTDSTPEISLDLQAARAVCANCRIVLVEAKRPTNTALSQAENTAVRLGADEVSNSFGGAEGTRRDKKLAKAFNHKGVVITASTGDDGWYSWDFANGSGRSNSAANTPSTLPTVVAVGGTKLLDTGKAAKPVRKSETVWNENGPGDDVGAPHGPQGATGGGCSRLFPAQRWQRRTTGFGKTSCGKRRLAADVSAVADPNTGFDVFDSFDGNNWFRVGGTSLSSPVVAAMWALAGGAHKVKYPALTVYGNAKSRRGSLHDVTLGGNALCGGLNPSKCAKRFKKPINRIGLGFLECSFHKHSRKRDLRNRQCVAAKGFDGPTGVGTPNGLGLFSRLSPSASIRVHHLHRGRRSTFRAKVRDPFPGGAIVQYRWRFGDGSHSKKRHPKHAYRKAKTYTVTLTVRDVFGLKHTVRKTVHVKKRH
jgi:PKD domain/Subtilase family